MTAIKIYFTNTKRILVEHFNNKIITAYITPKNHIESVDIITNVWQLINAKNKKKKTYDKTHTNN